MKQRERVSAGGLWKRTLWAAWILAVCMLTAAFLSSCGSGDGRDSEVSLPEFLLPDDGQGEAYPGGQENADPDLAFRVREEQENFPDAKNPPVLEQPPVRQTDGLMHCRLAGVLDAALVLARQDGAPSEAYLVPLTEDVKITLADGTPAPCGTDWASLVGSLAEVEIIDIGDGIPGRMNASALRLLAEGFDDRCSLYLRTLEDLWNRDAVLNGSIHHIGVDLSNTRLSPAEQTAAAYLFASAHGMWSGTVLGTWQELVDLGYITGAPVEGAASGAKVWQWLDGCLFIIEEKEWNFALLPSGPADGGAWMDNVFYDAVKWRTSLRASFLSDCWAWQDRAGRWGAYTVGIGD
ncbi:MAG: hypothetical protein IJT94_02190 [Oscillibacter sp.]|nr:hypothetical protein [Oscillibacter sp.]